MRRRVMLSIMVMVTALAVAQTPTRSIAPPEDVVDDEFVGYLMGLLLHDLDVTIPGDELAALFPEYEDDPSSPINLLITLERHPDGSDRRLDLVFETPLAHPAPLEVFGTRPVTLITTAALGVHEQHLRRSRLDGGKVRQAFMLTIVDGSFAVDFAPWLDFVLGTIMDDVTVRVVLAVYYEDRWYGCFVGPNPKGKPVTGVYDMSRNRFLAWPPREITQFALDQYERVK